MQKLNLNTSICNNAIFCGNKQTPMVSHNYWTVDQIQQQQKWLNKQPPKLKAIIIGDTTNPLNNIEHTEYMPNEANQCQQKDLSDATKIIDEMYQL